MASDITFRRPTELDHDTVVEGIDDWAAGRRARHLMPRLWFRHFTGTSWAATDDRDRAVGIAVAFVSPDEPSTAVLHLIGVDPACRRRGVGSELVARVVRDATARGAERIRTTAWPDDRPTIAFLEAVGFHLLEPPLGQRLFGTPAVIDFDEPGDDRAELERAVDAPARP
jgi:ribosomal protein S18 acetylase RimI-like enzyme